DSNCQLARTHVAVRRPRGELVGGAGFEPAKAEPPDLQSGPVGRFGIRPALPCARSLQSDGTAIVSPLAIPIRSGASDGTRTHNLQITNQVLCQLSYASGPAAAKGRRRIPAPPRSSRSREVFWRTAAALRAPASTARLHELLLGAAELRWAAARR